MEYISTRGGAAPVTISQAIRQGLAPDGGLYIPTELPRLDRTTFSAKMPFPELAAKVLAPFSEGDALAAEFEDMCRAAFNFPLELTHHEIALAKFYALELFHGPTAAFKDFGARFLAEALVRIKKSDEPPLTIVVATSGDTGGAVAAAFDAKPEANVVVLFPEGRVSPLQAHQLSCWSDNVLSLRVRPDFDTCQALAKQAFGNEEMRARFHLTSANSINIARLLAQVTYYAWASLQVEDKEGEPANFVIPTGNLGNGLAAVWAKLIGFPIDRIIFAANANRPVADFFEKGQFEARGSVDTMANAMDVGAPSNFERLAKLGDRAALEALELGAQSIPDIEITRTITRHYDLTGKVWCPHTAAGIAVFDRLPPMTRQKSWVVVVTAHASKFAEVVEPLIETKIELAAPLKAILDRPARAELLEPTLESLSEKMAARFER